MRLSKLEIFIGSAAYSGYFPVASGTIGSAFALVVYLIPGFENLYLIIPATLLVTLIGVPIATKFEAYYGKDPKECTIDEVAGMWISLIGLPKTWTVIILTFVIWRIFDILKPPPIKQAESFEGGLGVMADDVVGGLITLIVMHLLVLWVL